MKLEIKYQSNEDIILINKFFWPRRLLFLLSDLLTYDLPFFKFQTKQAQMSPNKPKWAQMSPNDPKQAQMSPNKPKQAQTSPNEPKWAQTILNKPKWALRVEEYSTKTLGCSLNSNASTICSNSIWIFFKTDLAFKKRPQPNKKK